LWASWSILRSALRILLQGTPHDLELDNVTTALAAIDGVHDVHHVHAWTITSGQIVFSAHLHVPDPHQDGGRVLRTAAQLLREKFGVYFSTLQIEDQCRSEEHTSELQSRFDLVCRLLLEKKKSQSSHSIAH